MNFPIDNFKSMRYTINDIVIRVILQSAEADERSVLHMKKLYSAPSLELLAYCSATAISGNWQETYEEDATGINSEPWNNGELGWT